MKRILSLLGVLLLAIGVTPAQQVTRENLIIRAPKPYTTLVAAIEAAGGKVSYQFKYVNAIAAEVPTAALPKVRSMVAPDAISKDLIVPAPSASDVISRLPLTAADSNGVEAEAITDLGAGVADFAKAHPNAYLFNNTLTRADGLHADGKLGQGIIVGVIDSGIRPGFQHISLDGTVIGGEDFVGDALGFSNAGNSGHGTFVAGMISANVIFTFPTNALLNAVKAEAPGAVIGALQNQVPMIGSAPLSSIYGFRVFGPTGGAPESRILQAMERAIELRELWDDGDHAKGKNIQVVNMSLGGATIFAGLDLEDLLALEMLNRDIVLVASAGNTGPSSLTVGSPATSFGAITVGAASIAANERILRRLQYGPVNGARYRPFLGTQMSYFSSRGPNANGVIDPDVVASGFANYGQGFGSPPGGISLASGTSFSAPTVSGVAAVLRQKHPTATARQVRNAIIYTGNPGLLNDDSTELDRGTGYVDAQAASAWLATGTVPDSVFIPSHVNPNVKVNIEQNTFLKVYDGNVQLWAANLKPGERFEVPYRVGPNTRAVIVSLSNFAPSLPPAQQNQLFGDDVLLAVHSAKTSSIDASGDYKVFEFTVGGAFVVVDPEEGILRVTVNGDWTNAGNVSAQVNIVALKDPLPQFTQQGKINHHQLLGFPINIPAGTKEAAFRLWFRQDWSHYPTTDLDMILVAPNGTVNGDGAGLSDPEQAVIKNPLAGTWTVLVDAFNVPGGVDKYELRVSLDGKVVK